MLISIKTLKSKAAETNGAGHCHVNMRMYGCQYDLLYFLVKIHV